MNKARKVFMILLCLIVIVGIFSMPVRADEVYEPFWTDFYYDHIEDIDEVEEIWEINAEGGVRLMYEPDSDETIYTFDEIGTRLWLYAIYTDPDTGNQWGYTDYYAGDYTLQSGWIPMKLLWKSYGFDDFFAEYRSEIRTENGGFLPDKTTAVHFYEYPGGRETYAAETDPENMEPIPYSSVYMDGQDRKWCMIRYWLGTRDCWFCFDAPEASYEELWPKGAPETDRRERIYYSVTYSENESAVAEIPEPSRTENTTETTETAAETDSTEAGEKTTETETEEESTRVPETENRTEATEAPVSRPDPVKRLPRWIIPAAVAGVLAVTAAVLLLILIGRKKK